MRGEQKRERSGRGKEQGCEDGGPAGDVADRCVARGGGRREGQDRKTRQRSGGVSGRPRTWNEWVGDRLGKRGRGWSKQVRLTMGLEPESPSLSTGVAHDRVEGRRAGSGARSVDRTNGDGSKGSDAHYIGHISHPDPVLTTSPPGFTALRHVRCPAAPAPFPQRHGSRIARALAC